MDEPLGYWIKVPHEVLNDPDICRLDDNLYRLFFSLLLIAGELNMGGYLIDAYTMSMSLGMDINDLYSGLYKLISKGLINQVETRWFIPYFPVWQNMGKKTERKNIKTPDGNKISYKDYLKTEHWKNKRAQILIIDNYSCQECGDRENLQVHHLNYDNLWDEKESDLITLCNFCHAEAHGRTI